MCSDQIKGSHGHAGTVHVMNKPLSWECLIYSGRKLELSLREFKLTLYIFQNTLHFDSHCSAACRHSRASPANEDQKQIFYAVSSTTMDCYTTRADKQAALPLSGILGAYCPIRSMFLATRIVPFLLAFSPHPLVCHACRLSRLASSTCLAMTNLP